VISERWRDTYTALSTSVVRRLVEPKRGCLVPTLRSLHFRRNYRTSWMIPEAKSAEYAELLAHVARWCRTQGRYFRVTWMTSSLQRWPWVHPDSSAVDTAQTRAHFHKLNHWSSLGATGKSFLEMMFAKLIALLGSSSLLRRAASLNRSVRVRTSQRPAARATDSLFGCVRIPGGLNVMPLVRKNSPPGSSVCRARLNTDRGAV